MPNASFAAESGGARVTVVDEIGHPIPGVVVQLLAADGSEPRNFHTDKHGFFSVLGLEPGRYAASVHVVGRPAACSVEDVESGELRTFRIVVASTGDETACNGQRFSGGTFDPDETADVYRIH